MEGRYDDEDELRKYIGSKYQLDIWSILYFYLDLIKYCVILSLIYWGSQKCFRAFDEEKEAVASKPPTLSTELLGDDELSDDSEDETENKEEFKAKADELLKTAIGRGKDNEVDKNVTWQEMYNSMLGAYKKKYPDYGPSVPNQAVGDEYDDEMKAMFQKYMGKDFDKKTN